MLSFDNPRAEPFNLTDDDLAERDVRVNFQGHFLHGAVVRGRRTIFEGCHAWVVWRREDDRSEARQRVDPDREEYVLGYGQASVVGPAWTRGGGDVPEPG